MTNKEKKQYIEFMTEYNRHDYNNENTNNFIGKMASKYYQFFLKIQLMCRYKEPYKSLRENIKKVQEELSKISTDKRMT